MTTIQTQRLVLRPFSINDLEDFYAYAKDPRIGPAAGWQPHQNKEVSAEILQDFIEKEEVWAIQLKEEGRVVGSIGLHKDVRRENTQSKMLGYVLAAQHWGRGYATEAARRVVTFGFEEMELDLLSVIHFPFNTASQRVIEKCGFVREGTLRRAFCRYDGKVFDDVCYSILKEEYFGKLKEKYVDQS